MPIYRSRALTGSAEPRPPARQIKDAIQHRCTTCNQTYSIDWTRQKPGIPGTFYITQGHLQVTCPEGHHQEVQTTIQHTA